MPNIEEASDAQQLSEVIFSWPVPDDVKYAKNVWWYVVSFAIVIAVVWWSIYIGNPLFAVFIVLFYLVVLMYEYRPPQIINFAITPDGVKMGKNFYYYKEFDHFYVVYQEQGVKNLYLEMRNPLRGRLIVSVDGQDAVAVREYLLGFLNEDLEREAEPLSERIRRLLRL